MYLPPPPIFIQLLALAPGFWDEPVADFYEDQLELAMYFADARGEEGDPITD